MAGEIAARRHAQAVFQIAKERGELDKWRLDLGLLSVIFSDSALISLLDDPKIRFEDKISVLSRNLPDAGEMVLNLIRLLISRRRVRIIPQLAREYGRLVDREEGIDHAEVTTAVPIDEQLKASLKDRLVGLTGRNVIISTKVDPEIMGGFIARVGDKLIDASVRTSLRKLRNSLAQSA